MKQTKTLHIICQSHLDPVWLWRWPEGFSEALATLQSACDRLQENPGMRFSRASAEIYRWVERADPRLFAKIRSLVKAGRWEAVGGWIEQPDCNLPSTESFYRQCLLGKGYFREKLGVETRVGYNVDSFGHSGGLPQILSGAGYKYYVFMRPNDQEMPGLPRLFWWQGDSKARVLAWRVPRTYCQCMTDDPDGVEAALRRTAAEDFTPGFNDEAFFLGVGNHGGGPTKAHLARVVKLMKDPSLPKIRFSTLQEFFTALEASPALASLPVVRGDLLHHAPGCYSAHAGIKALNRRAEKTLVQGETLAWMGGEKSGREAIRQGWWRLLFNQFHDILAGSSIRSAYRDTRDALGGACQAGSEAAVESAHRLARLVDTRKADSQTLCLVNALPWKVRQKVEVHTITGPDNQGQWTHLEDSKGNRIPLQWIWSESPFPLHNLEWKDACLVAEVPTCGWRMLQFKRGLATETFTPAGRVGEKALGLESFQAPDQAQMLSAPAALVVVEDEGDTWGHGLSSYRKELGRPALQETRVMEDGPVCKKVRQKAVWGKSVIWLDIVFYRDLGATELRFRINWQETRQMLKFEFPLALQNPFLIAKTAGGQSVRQIDGKEVPAQDWLAVQGSLSGKPYAFGLVNDGTYGYDSLGSLLRADLLRSGYYGQHDPVQPVDKEYEPLLDQGWMEKRFWLMAGPGGHEGLELQRRCEELQQPVRAVLDSAHPGTAAWEGSLLEVGPENVLATAVKPAEDGKGLILRVQETAGRNTKAVITAGKGKAFRVSLKAWEIKTVRILGGRLLETDALERPLKKTGR